MKQFPKNLRADVCFASSKGAKSDALITTMMHRMPAPILEIDDVQRQRLLTEN